MSARKGGIRRGTRRKFKKSRRDRGKISLTKYFTNYEPGEKTLLNAEPAVQKGLYHARFHAKAGTVVDKRGMCYGIQIKDGNKLKTLYIHPIHLRKVK